MTFHEFVSDDVLAEIRRMFTPAGRLVIVNWTATGIGGNSPPLDERYIANTAADVLRDHGFSIEHQFSRPETFLLVTTIE